MRVIVFTAILGTSDSLKPAPSGVDRAVCFVDDVAAHPDDRGWELVGWTYEGDPRREAWRLRCLPHLLFEEEYDRVIWIDASFTLTDVPRLLRDAGDAPIAALPHLARRTCYQEAKEIIRIGQADAASVQRQMQQYRADGYAPASLSISCIIVRSNARAVRAFNEEWAAQIAAHPGDNTQLSLDYSAWKHGMAIAPLRGGRKDTPYAVHDHADHKRRRRPYTSAVGAR